MTHEEEQAFFSNDEVCEDSRQTVRQGESLQQSDNHTTNDPEGEDIPPSWEHAWNDDMEQPAFLPEENFSWETWLEEIKELPISGYKPI